MSGGANRLFPLALIILMAGLTLWLNNISRLSPSRVQLDPNEPQYVSEHVAGTRFDAQGSIYDRLVADKLWQYPKQHDVHFINATIRQYKQDVLDSQASALDGTFNSQSKQVFLDHQAYFMKPAHGKASQTTLNGTAISIDTVHRFAASSQPATMRDGRSIATSTGFTYDYTHGLIKLLANAKVTYVK